VTDLSFTRDAFGAAAGLTDGNDEEFLSSGSGMMLSLSYLEIA